MNRFNTRGQRLITQSTDGALAARLCQLACLPYSLIDVGTFRGIDRLNSHCGDRWWRLRHEIRLTLVDSRGVQSQWGSCDLVSFWGYEGYQPKMWDIVSMDCMNRYALMSLAHGLLDEQAFKADNVFQLNRLWKIGDYDSRWLIVKSLPGPDFEHHHKFCFCISTLSKRKTL